MQVDGRGSAVRRGASLESIVRNLKGKQLVNSYEAMKEGSAGSDVGRRSVPSMGSTRSQIQTQRTLPTTGVWGVYGQVQVNMSWRRKSERGCRRLHRRRKVASCVFRYRTCLDRRGKAWAGGSIGGGGHIAGGVRVDLHHPMS